MAAVAAGRSRSRIGSRREGKKRGNSDSQHRDKRTAHQREQGLHRSSHWVRYGQIDYLDATIDAVEGTLRIEQAALAKTLID